MVVKNNALPFGNMPIANGNLWQISSAVLKYKSALTYKELFTI